MHQSVPFRNLKLAYRTQGRRYRKVVEGGEGVSMYNTDVIRQIVPVANGGIPE